MTDHVPVIAAGDRITMMKTAWLNATLQLSQSQRTIKKYTEVWDRFRVALYENTLDYDSPVEQIALFAQLWASQSHREGLLIIAGSTTRHTLVVISSFYSYCVKMGFITTNPIQRLTLPKVQTGHGAEALDHSVVATALRAIDLKTLLGQRDLSLLIIALATGRRAIELSHLNLGDITKHGKTLTLRWRVKGGNIQTNHIDEYAAAALVAYLQRHYGTDWQRQSKELPVWVSLSPHGLGQRLSYWGIRDVYIKRLNVSKVHTSRHTFASLELAAGADVIELMRALGHRSLDVTHHYVVRLQHNQPNPRGAAIGTLLGFPQPLATEPDESAS